MRILVHPPAAIAEEDAVGVAGAGGVRVDDELLAAPPRARHRREALRRRRQRRRRRRLKVEARKGQNDGGEGQDRQESPRGRPHA